MSILSEHAPSTSCKETTNNGFETRSFRVDFCPVWKLRTQNENPHHIGSWTPRIGAASFTSPVLWGSEACVPNAWGSGGFVPLHWVSSFSPNSLHSLSSLQLQFLFSSVSRGLLSVDQPKNETQTRANESGSWSQCYSETRRKILKTWVWLDRDMRQFESLMWSLRSVWGL